MREAGDPPAARVHGDPLAGPSGDGVVNRVFQPDDGAAGARAGDCSDDRRPHRPPGAEAAVGADGDAGAVLHDDPVVVDPSGIEAIEGERHRDGAREPRIAGDDVPVVGRGAELDDHVRRQPVRVDARGDLGRARAGEAVAHRARGRRAGRCSGVLRQRVDDGRLVAGEARVEAGRQRQSAAVAPARDADLERQAEPVVDEDAAAGVSLARVDASLRIPRAEHRGRHEAASEGVDLGVARDVVDDRHGGLEQDVGAGAARGGHAPADDAREHARDDVGCVLRPRERDALHARRSPGPQAQERPVVGVVAALRLVGPPVEEVDLAHHLHGHEPEVVHADLGLDADPGQEIPVVVGDAVGGREQPALADQRRPALDVWAGRRRRCRCARPRAIRRESPGFPRRSRGGSARPGGRTSRSRLH